MYRVTTPTHTFNLPFEANIIDKFILSYKQDGEIILEKNQDSDGVQLLDHQLAVTLTQSETSNFSPSKASVQLKVKIGEKVLASNVLCFYVDDVINKEVM